MTDEYMVLEGTIKMRPVDGNGNGNGNGEDPQGEIVYISEPDIRWEVGVGDDHPSVGNGLLLAWYTREEFSNGTRINLSIWLHRDGGSAGVSSGGYEIILPEAITPTEEWYSSHFNIWMSGSGKKEYTGSAKWHLTDKAADDDPMRIIFTMDGVEWSPTEPRPYGSQCKIRMTGFEYLL
jgi:hypothetical protein